MSGKRMGRKSNHKRRSRRTNPGQLAAAAVGAVALCAAFVCVVVFIAGRFVDKADGEKTTDMALGDIQDGSAREETAPEIPEEASPQDASVGGQKEGQEPDVEVPETADADKETEEQTSETEPAVTTISILGDSISTFQGYIPADIMTFPERAGIRCERYLVEAGFGRYGVDALCEWIQFRGNLRGRFHGHGGPPVRMQ